MGKRIYEPETEYIIGKVPELFPFHIITVHIKHKSVMPARARETVYGITALSVVIYAPYMVHSAHPLTSF